MAISPKLLNEGESIVLSTRTHLKVLLLPLLILLVSIAAAAWLSSLVDDAGNGIVRIAIWVVAAIVVAWWVIRPVLAWLTATYTVTNRRIITRSGIITRRGHDIPLNRISDVSYEHGLIDRMLGCGTLIIADASTHGRVELKDIPRAEDAHRQLTQLLHEIHSPRRDEGV